MTSQQFLVTLSLFLFAGFFTHQVSASAELDSLILQGILDLDVPSGGSDGKALHFLAVDDVDDLSVYGIGTANNGGGTDGQEYAFPAEPLDEGQHLLLARSTAAMSAYFGACIAEFDVVMEASTAVNQNGDDAIELFLNEEVIETYGDADVDGSGESWEYSDSWAFKSEEGDWTVGELGCSSGENTEDSACPYPLCNESEGIPGCTAETACNYDVEATVDDLTCVYPGDACDDDDALTVFDTLTEACDCEGTVFEPSNQLILTGIIHAGAAPKALELYVMDDLETLGQYGLGTAQNGGGTDGVEWSFPDEGAEAGSFIYVTNDAEAFTAYFGFTPTFGEAGAVCNFNGNDALELFEAGIPVDTYGEIDVDGLGASWEYTDAWAYRVNGTGPDGNAFVQANWNVSALGVTDGPLTNEFSNEPFPNGTYNNTPDGINEWTSDAIEMRIFPNPTAGGTVRVQSTSTIQTLTIHSLGGQLIHSVPVSGQTAFFNADELARGIYTIQAISPDGDRQISLFVKSNH
jgi:hypothetical protein